MQPSNSEKVRVDRRKFHRVTGVFLELLQCFEEVLRDGEIRIVLEEAVDFAGVGFEVEEKGDWNLGVKDEFVGAFGDRALTVEVGTVNGVVGFFGFAVDEGKEALELDVLRNFGTGESSWNGVRRARINPTTSWPMPR